MSDLLALAERCEAATGSDRELDAVVWLHLPEQSGHDWKHGGDRFKHAAQIAGCTFIPTYTASLDAAMTLVPEGSVFNVMTDYELPGRARVYDGYATAQADGATPALALTAACLRACHALTSPTD